MLVLGEVVASETVEELAEAVSGRGVSMRKVLG
jgi:hypothetical protein